MSDPRQRPVQHGRRASSSSGHECTLRDPPGAAGSSAPADPRWAKGYPRARTGFGRDPARPLATDDNDRRVGYHGVGDSRQELRRSAEQNRREAAALEPERQDADRCLGAIERPIGGATAELDAAKRSLAAAREGEIARRLVAPWST